ncbi:polysaccharide pyruvyl transferase family protein [Shewanella gelidii]|uniref:Polysaccharide pyruvyl transferase domain-containing protein n=1 Tax=Shewanella gelidii TaxID=1642821 RepID=A0A917NAA8_9GAMM|nr:polysaccharide pyruvyl transferase family protein [Shewanella gelidii]MCL1099164.1 polysaccharide pyruvyl transferase family protein [Shewanella gelidii]GGI81241.1 hypothetical protein GCM10009332_18220 [Shewanella gelidii]
MIDLETFIQQAQIQDFIYIPNPGNAGDSLINAATFQFFDRLGLRYQVVSPKLVKQCLKKGRDLSQVFEFSGKVVVLGGGGAFTSHYTYSNRLVRELMHKVEHLVLLPCTIEGNAETLREMPENVTLFCREQVSYDYVKSQNEQVTVYLHHDMVLGLDVQRLIEEPAKLSSMRKKLKAYRNLKRVTSVIQQHGHQCLSALRLDKEKTARTIPKGNLDMSTLFSLGTQTKEDNIYSAQQFLTQLNRFERVITNRLHVCIASTLLGKQVEFLGNSYFKNKAVYDLSLRQYNNVAYVSE